MRAYQQSRKCHPDTHPNTSALASSSLSLSAPAAGSDADGKLISKETRFTDSSSEEKLAGRILTWSRE